MSQDATQNVQKSPPAPMRFLRMSQVEDRIGLQKRTIQRMVAAEEFPSPVPIHERSVGFLEAEVDLWMTYRIEARDKGPEVFAGWGAWKAQHEGTA